MEFHLLFRGDESRLVDCEFDGMETREDHHDNDASVSCGMLLRFLIFMKLSLWWWCAHNDTSDKSAIKFVIAIRSRLRMVDAEPSPHVWY